MSRFIYVYDIESGMYQGEKITKFYYLDKAISDRAVKSIEPVKTTWIQTPHGDIIETSECREKQNAVYKIITTWDGLHYGIGGSKRFTVCNGHTMDISQVLLS